MSIISIGKKSNSVYEQPCNDVFYTSLRIFEQSLKNDVFHQFLHKMCNITKTQFLNFYFSVIRQFRYFILFSDKCRIVMF